MTTLINSQQKQWHQAQALTNANVTVNTMLPAVSIIKPSASERGYDFRKSGLLFKDSR